MIHPIQPIAPIPPKPPKAHRCPRCGRDRWTAACGSVDCVGIRPATIERFRGWSA